MLLSILIALALSVALHLSIEKFSVRVTIGFILGLVVSVIIGIVVGMMVESGGNVAQGKDIALAGFKNSLVTAIATVILIWLAQTFSKKPPEVG